MCDTLRFLFEDFLLCVDRIKNDFFNWLFWAPIVAHHLPANVWLTGHLRENEKCVNSAIVFCPTLVFVLIRKMSFLDHFIRWSHTYSSAKREWSILYSPFFFLPISVHNIIRIKYNDMSGIYFGKFVRNQTNMRNQFDIGHVIAEWLMHSIKELWNALNDLRFK